MCQHKQTLVLRIGNVVYKRQMRLPLDNHQGLSVAAMVTRQDGRMEQGDDPGAVDSDHVLQPILTDGIKWMLGNQECVRWRNRSGAWG